MRNLIRTGIAVVVLLPLTLLLRDQGGKAANRSTAPPRGFYLTTDAAYDGSQALTACAAGYHMASLSEIHEPSNLRYDTSLGFTEADSGEGMPIFAFGWYRTGGKSSNQVNCLAWTLNELAIGHVLGMGGNLPSDTWIAAQQGCNTQQRVWCVQD